MKRPREICLYTSRRMRQRLSLGVRLSNLSTLVEGLEQQRDTRRLEAEAELRVLEGTEALLKQILAEFALTAKAQVGDLVEKLLGPGRRSARRKADLEMSLLISRLKITREALEKRQVAVTEKLWEVKHELQELEWLLDHELGIVIVRVQEQLPKDLHRQLASYLGDMELFDSRGISPVFRAAYYNQHIVQRRNRQFFWAFRAIKLAELGLGIFPMVEHIELDWGDMLNDDESTNFTFRPDCFPRLWSIRGNYVIMMRPGLSTFDDGGLCTHRGIRLTTFCETVSDITQERYPNLETLIIHKCDTEMFEFKPLNKLSTIEFEIDAWPEFLLQIDLQKFPQLRTLRLLQDTAGGYGWNGNRPQVLEHDDVLWFDAEVARIRALGVCVETPNLVR